MTILSRQCTEQPRPPSGYRPELAAVDEIFERAYANYVRTNRLFSTLAVMAFAICVAGLFGMATFVAGRRRQEIGVRKTLGGKTSQMIALLLASFSRPVLVANLVAWPAGYFAGFLSSLPVPSSRDQKPRFLLADAAASTGAAAAFT